MSFKPANITQASKILRGFLQYPSSPAIRETPGVKRFRKVSEPVGLKPFVELSDQASAIADAHPELRGEVRQKLYENWLKWNPDSFLILEVLNADHNWQTAAVSIIFPITEKALKDMACGKEDAVLNLEKDDICATDNAKILLVDTWIINPEISKFIIGNTAHSLITAHLAMFGDLKDKKIIIEPDADNMKELASKTGFDELAHGYHAMPFSNDNIAANPFLPKFMESAKAWSEQPLASLIAQQERHIAK